MEICDHGPLFRNSPKLKVTDSEVAELKLASEAFVAVTTHLVAWYATTLVPVIKHPVPLTEYETAPVPDPPVVLNAMGTPALDCKVEVEITKALWLPENVKVTEDDFAHVYPSAGALYAVTTQLVVALAVKTLFVTVQLDPVL